MVVVVTMVVEEEEVFMRVMATFHGAGHSVAWTNSETPEGS
jgi:hypothetical protein